MQTIKFFPKNSLLFFHNFILPSEYNIHVKINETEQLTMFYVF
jgi:hypothetical protein